MNTIRKINPYSPTFGAKIVVTDYPGIIGDIINGTKYSKKYIVVDVSKNNKPFNNAIAIFKAGEEDRIRNLFEKIKPLQTILMRLYGKVKINKISELKDIIPDIFK